MYTHSGDILTMYVCMVHVHVGHSVTYKSTLTSQCIHFRYTTHVGDIHTKSAIGFWNGNFVALFVTIFNPYMLWMWIWNLDTFIVCSILPYHPPSTFNTIYVNPYGTVHIMSDRHTVGWFGSHTMWLHQLFIYLCLIIADSPLFSALKEYYEICSSPHLNRSLS